MQQVIAIARESLSKLCIDSCKAKCCKQGNLFLSEYDVKKNNISHTHLTKHKSGMYVLDLTTKCPLLSAENTCSIYGSRDRPTICLEFPIFLRGNSVYISTFCPHTKSKGFMKYVKILKEKGLKIIWQ